MNTLGRYILSSILSTFAIWALFLAVTGQADLARALAFVFLIYIILPLTILKISDLCLRRDYFIMVVAGGGSAVLLQPIWGRHIGNIFLLSAIVDSVHVVWIFLLPVLVLSIMTPLFVWTIVIMIVDPFLSKRRPTQLDLKRFDEIWKNSSYADLKIGISLSGGGYKGSIDACRCSFRG